MKTNFVRQIAHSLLAALIAAGLFAALVVVLCLSAPKAFADEKVPSKKIDIKQQDPQCRELAALEKRAQNTRSTLLFTKLSMLNRKCGKAPTTDPQRRAWRNRWARNNTPYTLRVGVHRNALPNRDGQGVHREIGLLTGKRAIDESLQLESIRRARPIHDKPSIELSAIAPLEIASHPWDEMLKRHKVHAISPIFQLVPEDHFVVYFKNVAKVRELEDALKEIAAVGEHFFTIEEVLSIRKKITKRLGIEEFAKLEELIDEIAFVSEDLAFYPRTHYALIFKFKSPALNSLTSYLKPGVKTSKTVGDYFVVSSSAELLSKIEKASSGELASMYNSKDFHYTQAVLEPQRDGLVYFSEKFIRKLVSPEYRINAARREQAIAEIESLQYTVFAYKSITKNWPPTLEHIAAEGFIDQASLREGFTVGDDGIVRHKQWGTLYQLKPISENPLSLVSKNEKQRYDRFRTGYQSFWREFFDPVGIAVSVGEQLYFHTIILPLIDNSEYRELKLATGGKTFLKGDMLKTLKPSPIILRSKLRIEDMVLESERKSYKYRNKKVKPTDKEIKAAINEKTQKDLQLNPPIDVFSLVGDEVIIGLGPKLGFEIKNISNIELYVALKLQNTKRFTQFLNQIYAKFFSQTMQSRRAGSSPFPAMGFFQLSSEEPLKNTYNSVEYSMVPTGFVNLYYFFHDDYNG